MGVRDPSYRQCEGHHGICWEGEGRKNHKIQKKRKENKRKIEREKKNLMARAQSKKLAKSKRSRNESIT